GREALARIDELAPELLTLDVRMPGMDGIDVLRELKSRRFRAKAIMVSGFTAEGAQVTTDALMEGAFDFILKPGGPDAAANRQAPGAARGAQRQDPDFSRKPDRGARPPHDGPGAARRPGEIVPHPSENSLRGRGRRNVHRGACGAARGSHQDSGRSSCSGSDRA